MKKNHGSELLIPRGKWVLADDLCGEGKVLNHPIIDLAFERILKEHKPAHKVALLSLCTGTRPYSKSVKWKKYIDIFSDKADLIVVSGGGVIPSRFWECYPYMTYDVEVEARDLLDLYREKMFNRVQRFFEEFRYKYVVANFPPGMRNRSIALDALNELVASKHIKSFRVTPNPPDLKLDKSWRIKRNQDKPGYWTRYQELNPNALAALEKAILTN